MGRYPQAPWNFTCIYCNSCPYLNGHSATYALELMKDVNKRSFFEGKQEHLYIQELEALSNKNKEWEKKFDELSAKFEALHRLKFKPNPKPDRPVSKKRGAPVGHKFWKRKTPKHIDRTVSVEAPCACPHCDSVNLLPSSVIHEQIQEDIVLRPKTLVTKYSHKTKFCPKCRRPVFKTAPEELRNCEIGPVAKSTASYLRQILKLSTRDVRRLFNDIFGMSFVPASVLAFDAKLASQSKEHYKNIQNKLQASNTVHADETSWRIDGNSGFLWYGGTTSFSYFHIDPSRAGSVASTIFGSNFQGNLVADDYAGYNAINAQNRQTCLAHIIRKARDLIKELSLLPNHPDKQTSISFCNKLKSLFSDACTLAKKRKLKKISFTNAKDKIPSLYKRLNLICANSQPNPSCESFRQRLLDPKRDYHRLFVFLNINHMEPTNNHAEQILRQPVINRKITFGHRSNSGAEVYATILSVITTLKQQGLDSLSVLHSILLNGSNHPSSSIFNNSS